jgi:hypothetical protein
MLILLFLALTVCIKKEFEFCQTLFLFSLKYGPGRFNSAGHRFV